MSYLIAEDSIGLKVDVLTPYDVSGGIWLIDTPSSYNTDISVNGGTGTITLYSGSSYYIEAAVTGRCDSASASLSWQLYNSQSAQLIGQDAYFSLKDWADRPRIGRKVAKALILDSDISTSTTVQVKLTASSGVWIFGVNLGVGIQGQNYMGYPSVRIWQLPS
jgi:hypothetical protein